MRPHISKILRKNHTPWELKLWGLLRNKKLAGLKFRRQFKIGPYIVDFCCLEKKLIIELDGGHHNLDTVIPKDDKRDRFLKQLGFSVLRFWNNELDSNPEGVTEAILRYS